MNIKEIPILFVGQCKNGSNAMVDFLTRQKGFIRGETAKASCRERVEEKTYYSNWQNSDLAGARYLIDKSLIIPDRAYYKGKGVIKRNKIIYILRNPYAGIRSHFLVALRGETCYSKFLTEIPRLYLGEEDILRLNFKQVCAIIDRNPFKIAHTLIIPRLVNFFPEENIFFTTLEDLNKGRAELKRLERFLSVRFVTYFFPHIGKTTDKFHSELNLYLAGQAIFDKYAQRIFKRYIRKAEWEKISVYFGQDLVSKYGIQ